MGDDPHYLGSGDHSHFQPGPKLGQIPMLAKSVPITDFSLTKGGKGKWVPDFLVDLGLFDLI